MGIPVLSARDARRLLLGAQGLLDDPARRATVESVGQLVRGLGFVQIDSINVVERAHHLTLATRLDGYRPAMLHDLIERRRTLFENWTHDASAISSEFFAHWHHRFRRYRKAILTRSWWRERLGARPGRLLRQVLDRVRDHGETLSRDFDDERRGEKGWWGWKPQKAALEHLWRTGDLAVTRRVNFQKVYDLTERALPHLHALPPSLPSAHLDWACRSALARLGAATPKEIAGFWHAVGASQAARWCRSALRRGEVEEVLVEAADGSESRPAFAVADWRERLESLPDAPRRARLLSPFDPVVRDRRRAKRLFNFDYTIEVYVPAAKRKYGYYVMPVMDGEEIVARLDPKFDREAGTLRIRQVWWQKGAPTAAARRRLEAAVERLAVTIGAEHVALP